MPFEYSEPPLFFALQSSSEEYDAEHVSVAGFEPLVPSPQLYMLSSVNTQT